LKELQELADFNDFTCADCSASLVPVFECKNGGLEEGFVSFFEAVGCLPDLVLLYPECLD